ncbi:MAG: PilN domain-containing protein [Methylococcales bacterium]|nr:PilN domain-containing protein [Methylococcales bacterium]
MNLQTTIDFDLKGFFRWWGGELAFLIPKRIRQLLSVHTASVAFTATESGFDVCFRREAGLDQPVFSRHLSSADADAFQQLKNHYPDLENAEHILCLTDSQAIARLLYLPEATLENLQQVVGFELDRYTPFTAEQVYFSVTALGKTGQGQVQVLLVLSPKTLLDEQLAQLNAWGVQPARIEYQRLQHEFPQWSGQYNLLPDHYRPETNKLAQFVNWFLNSLMFALFMAVLVFPVLEEKQAVDALKSQIKAMEKDTRMVDEQQREIDALQEQTRRLIDIKAQTPEPLTVINELSHMLKDDTWLTNLQYTEKHIQIQGQSPTASALISLLEESPLFSKVSFVSPLTQDKTTGLERFQISMDVSPKLAADELSATGQTETQGAVPTMYMKKP